MNILPFGIICLDFSTTKKIIINFFVINTDPNHNQITDCSLLYLKLKRSRSRTFQLLYIHPEFVLVWFLWLCHLLVLIWKINEMNKIYWRICERDLLITWSVNAWGSHFIHFQQRFLLHIFLKVVRKGIFVNVTFLINLNNFN